MVVELSLGGSITQPVPCSTGAGTVVGECWRWWVLASMWGEDGGSSSGDDEGRVVGDRDEAETRV